MAIRIKSYKHGGPEVSQTVESTPADPTGSETQVENKVIGINFIGMHIRSGFYPLSSLPGGLGTEAAGIVSKVGSGVRHIKIGDRVVYTQSVLGAYSSVYNINADKAAILPVAISFEQAVTSSLKGLMVYYLLHKIYETKPDEQFLPHAAAGGAGLIACQRMKALGAELIGTVGTTQRAQGVLRVDVWQAIDYREGNLVERLKETTGGKRVHVVYDSVDRDTWEWSPGCLQHRGLIMSFGNSLGAITGVNLGILNQRGSLYVTRSSLQGYTTTREELTEANNELFSLIASGVIKADVTEQQKYPPRDARRAHEVLGGRVMQGFSLLIP